MLDNESIQLVAQLIDNMISLSEKMENSYYKEDIKKFSDLKKEILDIQKKLSKYIV